MYSQMMDISKNFIKNISNDYLNNLINSTDSILQELGTIIKSEKDLINNSELSENIKCIKDNLLLSAMPLFKEKEYIGCKTQLLQLIENKYCDVLPRAYAENSYEYRQLINNAVFISSLSNGEKMYGFLERAENYNEPELGSKIGFIGGHMNESDNTNYIGLVREISEEIINFSFEDIIGIKQVGFIREANKNKTISDKHLCILYEIYCDLNVYKLKSHGNIEKLIWLNQNEILNEYNSKDSRFDSWVMKYIENNII